MQIDRMVFNGNCSGNICALDSFRVYYLQNLVTLFVYLPCLTPMGYTMCVQSYNFYLMPQSLFTNLMSFNMLVYRFCSGAYMSSHYMDIILCE